MKRAVWVILLCTSSARVRFTEGGGGGSVTLHPFFAAKWIQLSIQCFRSINEDSLSQCALLLLQHNLDPHAVFRPVRLYPVAHGNQRWLCSSGSCCSSLPVWIFMFSLISLNILFFNQYLYAHKCITPNPVLFHPTNQRLALNSFAVAADIFKSEHHQWKTQQSLQTHTQRPQLKAEAVLSGSCPFCLFFFISNTPASLKCTFPQQRWK